MCKEKLVLDLSQFLRTPFSSITAFSSTVLETHDELASESLTTTMHPISLEKKELGLSFLRSSLRGS